MTKQLWCDSFGHAGALLVVITISHDSDLRAGRRGDLPDLDRAREDGLDVFLLCY